MTSVTSSLFGYTETDLAVAAILEPPPPGTNDDGEYDDWLANVENRAATIQFLTREHATNDGEDPLLHSLERLHRQRDELQQQMKHLVAYMREHIKPRPYTLEQVAAAAGLSVSGTRTYYDSDDVRTLDEHIAEVKQAIGEEHARHGTIPGRPTIAIDTENADPIQTVSPDGTLERIRHQPDADAVEE